MSETTLERLARSAAKAAVLEAGILLDEGIYEPIVRAILRELREPSEGMLIRGLWAATPDERDSPSALIRAWQAMLDHILSEDSNGQT